MAQRGAADNQTKPGRAAVTIESLRIVDDGDGGLVLADAGDTAARPIDDGDGGMVLDDEATSGYRVLSAPTGLGVH